MAIGATAVTLLLSLVAALVTVTIYSNPYKFDEPFIPLAGRLISEVNVDGITRLCHDGDDVCLLTGLSALTPDDANQIVYLKDIPTVDGGKELSKFRNGWGMSHTTNAMGDIVLAPRIEVGEGLLITPGGGEGDPIIIELNVSIITPVFNASHLSENVLVDKCAIKHTYVGGSETIELEVLLDGNDGITVGSCPDGGAQQIGLNGTAVVDTLDSVHFHDVYIDALCGLTTVMNEGVIEFALNVTSSEGITLNTPCGNNVALNIGLNGTEVIESLDVKHLVDTLFADACGITYDYDSTGNQIFSTLNFVGFDGVIVTANCSIPGGAIEINLNGTVLVDSIDMETLSQTKLDTTCGLVQAYDTMSEKIVFSLDFTSLDNSIIFDDSCSTGQYSICVNESRILQNVNASDVLEVLFEAGCGTMFEFIPPNDMIRVSTNLTGENGIIIDPACGVGEAQIISLDGEGVVDAINITYFNELYMNPLCGLTTEVNIDAIDFALNITGSDGVRIDSICSPGSALNIGLNGTEVIDSLDVEHFVETLFVDVCGISYDYDSTGNQIVSTLSIAGFDGVMVDVNCSIPGGPIEIHLNGTVIVDTLDMRTFSENNLVASCGIEQTYDPMLEVIILALNMTGGDGVVLGAPCGNDDALNIGLNGTALVDTFDMQYFSDDTLTTACGLLQSYVSMDDTIELSLNLVSLDGSILLDSSCGSGQYSISVNESFILQNINVSDAINGIFEPGCGITLDTIQPGDVIRVSTNLTGANGIIIEPSCGVGEAQIISLDSEGVVDTINITYFNELYMNPLCGLVSVVNGGMIDLSLNVTGSDGIRIDALCGADYALNIGLNGTEVIDSLDVKYLAETLFADVCGITYDYDSTGNQIYSTLQFVGFDGVIIDANCSIPGGAIEISLNGTMLVETLNTSFFSENKLIATCGLEQTYDVMSDAIVLSLNLTSSDGVVINQPCGDLDALNIGLNGTALVDTLNTQYFSDSQLTTECGLLQSYDVMNDNIVFSLDLVSLDNSILLDFSCDTGKYSICVNESRILQNVNASDVLNVLFEAGCGTMVEYIYPNDMVRVSTNLTGINGIIIDPACGVGEAQIISLDSEGVVDTINITYFNELYMNPLCGLASVVNGGMIELSLNITGSDGIRIDALCGADYALNIGLNGTEIIDSLDVKYLAETLFADVCGITYDYDSTGNQIFSTLQFVGFDGVIIDANCSIPGGAIEISLNGTLLVETLNTSYFSDNKLFAQCGITQVYDPMSDSIILSTDIVGMGGVIVDPSCPLGVQAISLDPNAAVDALNISHVYELWFANGCGITTNLSVGVIYNNLDLTSTDGSIVISSCTAGMPTDLSLSTVTAGRGGTGQTTAPLNYILVGDGSNWMLFAPGTANQVLRVNGMATALEWATPAGGAGGTVTTVSASLPLSVTSPTTTPAISLGGLSSFGTAGQVMSMDAMATALEWTSPTTGTLTGITAGTNIIVTPSPTSPTVSLTGIIAVANGGTGISTVTTGDVIYGSALNTWAKRPIGTVGQVLSVTAGLIPDWVTPNTGTLTGITAGTNIAVTPSPTSPTVSLTGTVAVANGGTGRNTLAAGSLMIGNVASPVTLLPHPGVAGQFLSSGAGTALTWVANPAAAFDVCTVSCLVDSWDVTTTGDVIIRQTDGGDQNGIFIGISQGVNTNTFTGVTVDSVLIGGKGNTLSGTNTVSIGGSLKTTGTGVGGFFGPGTSLTASGGSYTFMGTGLSNTISNAGQWNTILNGLSNRILFNTVNSDANAIYNGRVNTIDSTSSIGYNVIISSVSTSIIGNSAGNLILNRGTDLGPLTISNFNGATVLTNLPSVSTISGTSSHRFQPDTALMHNYYFSGAQSYNTRLWGTYSNTHLANAGNFRYDNCDTAICIAATGAPNILKDDSVIIVWASRTLNFVQSEQYPRGMQVRIHNQAPGTVVTVRCEGVAICLCTRYVDSNMAISCVNSLTWSGQHIMYTFTNFDRINSDAVWIYTQTN